MRDRVAVGADHTGFRYSVCHTVCHDTYSARQAVEHDDANVLCLGARVIGSDEIREARSP